MFLSFDSCSYRSWLEKIRRESPPFLTIVSLELPESPIPLIESQSNARWRRDAAADKDDILDEFLEKVTEAGKEREKEGRAGKNTLRKIRRNSRKSSESLECTKTLATLEECTRNIIEGETKYFLLKKDLL